MSVDSRQRLVSRQSLGLLIKDVKTKNVLQIQSIKNLRSVSRDRRGICFLFFLGDSNGLGSALTSNSFKIAKILHQIYTKI